MENLKAVLKKLWEKEVSLRRQDVDRENKLRGDSNPEFQNLWDLCKVNFGWKAASFTKMVNGYTYNFKYFPKDFSGKGNKDPNVDWFIDYYPMIDYVYRTYVVDNKMKDYYIWHEPKGESISERRHKLDLQICEDEMQNIKKQSKNKRVSKETKIFTPFQEGRKTIPKQSDTGSSQASSISNFSEFTSAEEEMEDLKYVFENLWIKGQQQQKEQPQMTLQGDSTDKFQELWSILHRKLGWTYGPYCQKLGYNWRYFPRSLPRPIINKEPNIDWFIDYYPMLDYAYKTYVVEDKMKECFIWNEPKRQSISQSNQIKKEPEVGKDEKNTSKRKCVEKKETISTTRAAKGSSRRNSISSPKSKTKTKKQNMEKELDIPTGTEASFEDLWRKLAKRKWSLITIRGQTRFCLPHCPSGSNLRAAREEEDFFYREDDVRNYILENPILHEDVNAEEELNQKDLTMGHDKYASRYDSDEEEDEEFENDSSIPFLASGRKQIDKQDLSEKIDEDEPMYVLHNEGEPTADDDWKSLVAKLRKHYGWKFKSPAGLEIRWFFHGPYMKDPIKNGTLNQDYFLEGDLKNLKRRVLQMKREGTLIRIDLEQQKKEKEEAAVRKELKFSALKDREDIATGCEDLEVNKKIVNQRNEIQDREKVECQNEDEDAEKGEITMVYTPRIPENIDDVNTMEVENTKSLVIDSATMKDSDNHNNSLDVDDGMEIEMEVEVEADCNGAGCKKVKERFGNENVMLSSQASNVEREEKNPVVATVCSKEPEFPLVLEKVQTGDLQEMEDEELPLSLDGDDDTEKISLRGTMEGDDQIENNDHGDINTLTKNIVSSPSLKVNDNLPFQSPNNNMDMHKPFESEDYMNSNASICYQSEKENTTVEKEEIQTIDNVTKSLPVSDTEVVMVPPNSNSNCITSDTAETSFQSSALEAKTQKIGRFSSVEEIISNYEKCSLLLSPSNHSPEFEDQCRPEYKYVTEFLKACVRETQGGYLQVSGLPGTGKTMSIKYIVDSILKCFPSKNNLLDTSNISSTTASSPSKKNDAVFGPYAVYMNVHDATKDTFYNDLTSFLPKKGLGLSNRRASMNMKNDSEENKRSFLKRFNILGNSTNKTPKNNKGSNKKNSQTTDASVVKERSVKEQEEFTGRALVLVLDEVDMFASSCDEFSDMVKSACEVGSTLIIIGICNDPNYGLMFENKYGVRISNVVYAPFKKNQISTILNRHVGASFHFNSLDLISRKAEAYNGDIRMAMNVCSKALELGKINLRREVSEIEANHSIESDEGKDNLSKKLEEVLLKYDRIPNTLVMEACQSAYNRGGNKEVKSLISLLTDDQLLLLYIITWVIDQENLPNEKVHLKEIQSVYTRAKSHISVTSSNTANGDIKIILNVLKDYALIDLPTNFGSASNYNKSTTNSRDYITSRVRLIDVESATENKKLDQLKSMVQNRKGF